MTNLKAYAILGALAATSTLYPETTVNVNAVLGNKIRHDQTRVVSEGVDSTSALFKQFNGKVTGSNQTSAKKNGSKLLALMRKMKNR